MFAREIIYTPYFYVGSINEFSSKTRLSLIDRFATTEAEIEEKRLKLNAERTIKQNKAAENGKNIAYNYTVTCIMCAVFYIVICIAILVHLLYNK